jgi:hypothetical protein
MGYIVRMVWIGFLSASLAIAGEIVLPDILKPPSTEPKGPTVQIGLLLDTSSSMDGLINQARDQLWRIVNEVAKANRGNERVRIEVGLFEYGKSLLPRYQGYLQMLSPLTTDLDFVSQELFGLFTNGGEEYAGGVILEAVDRFAWSENARDMRLLIIAGNESFAQGEVSYVRAIAKAKAQGIVVNTIFCGEKRQGRSLHWEDGAIRGGGKYFTIDHDLKRQEIPTPYDEEIMALGAQLNDTYMVYGEEKMRQAKRINIAKQDSNAKEVSQSSYIERSLMKSKAQYASKESDMVSSFADDSRSLDAIATEEMPQELQSKSKAEIQAIVAKKAKQRASIQEQMKRLEQKREAFLASQKPKESNDLGSVMIDTIRTQAIDKGFHFDK